MKDMGEQQTVVLAETIHFKAQISLRHISLPKGTMRGEKKKTDESHFRPSLLCTNQFL